jgi:RNA polymerase sigma factor (sigma-70 family)
LEGWDDYSGGRDRPPPEKRLLQALPPLTTSPDLALARACDAGLPGAWERLQKEYRRRLLAFLRKRGAKRGEAEEVLEEALAALAEPPARGGARTQIGTYDGRGSLHAWLATLASRRLTDRWRARSALARLRPPAPEGGLHEMDPADRAAGAEAAGRVAGALEEAWPLLTPKELQAVVLKYRSGLAQTEIAEAMGVGEPRVSRLLSSATTRLRAFLEERLGSHDARDLSADVRRGAAHAVDRVLARAAAQLETSTAAAVADLPGGRR